MDRIDRIGPRHDVDRLGPILAPVRVERSADERERDRERERREREARDRERRAADGPEVHPAEPGHIDVSV